MVTDQRKHSVKARRSAPEVCEDLPIGVCRAALDQRTRAWCRPKTAHTFRHHAL